MPIVIHGGTDVVAKIRDQAAADDYGNNLGETQWNGTDTTLRGIDHLCGLEIKGQKEQILFTNRLARGSTQQSGTGVGRSVPRRSPSPGRRDNTRP